MVLSYHADTVIALVAILQATEGLSKVTKNWSYKKKALILIEHTGQTYMHLISLPMPALYLSNVLLYTFPQSICSVAIPVNYELTMKKKVELEKVYTNKVYKMKQVGCCATSKNQAPCS